MAEHEEPEGPVSEDTGSGYSIPVGVENDGIEIDVTIDSKLTLAAARDRYYRGWNWVASALSVLGAGVFLATQQVTALFAAIAAWVVVILLSQVLGMQSRAVDSKPLRHRQVKYRFDASGLMITIAGRSSLLEYSACRGYRYGVGLLFLETPGTVWYFIPVGNLPPPQLVKLDQWLSARLPRVGRSYRWVVSALVLWGILTATMWVVAQR